MVILVDVICRVQITLIVLFICSRGMYTESITPSVTKLYISKTHNKHAGPYTCVALDQLERTVAHRTITLLLYSKNCLFTYLLTYLLTFLLRSTASSSCVRHTLRTKCRAFRLFFCYCSFSIFHCIHF